MSDSALDPSPDKTIRYISDLHDRVNNLEATLGRLVMEIEKLRRQGGSSERAPHTGSLCGPCIATVKPPERGKPCQWCGVHNSSQAATQLEHVQERQEACVVLNGLFNAYGDGDLDTELPMADSLWKLEEMLREREDCLLDNTRMV